MNILIYSKSGCPNCVAAKNLLEIKKIPYTEENLDEPALMEAFKTLYPDAKQMPQIFCDGVRVGGFNGLLAALRTFKL